MILFKNKGRNRYFAKKNIFCMTELVGSLFRTANPKFVAPIWRLVRSRHTGTQYRMMFGRAGIGRKGI